MECLATHNIDFGWGGLGGENPGAHGKARALFQWSLWFTVKLMEKIWVNLRLVNYYNLPRKMEVEAKKLCDLTSQKPGVCFCSLHHRKNISRRLRSVSHQTYLKFFQGAPWGAQLPSASQWSSLSLDRLGNLPWCPPTIWLTSHDFRKEVEATGEYETKTQADQAVGIETY